MSCTVPWMSSTSGRADWPPEGPPAPTAFVEGHTGVDHSRLVIEVRGTEPSPHLPLAGSGWAATHPNLIILQPASEWTTAAAVRLEAWPAEPARSGPPHSDTSTVEATFDHHDIGARGFSAPCIETDLLSLRSPGSYQVRVYRWGGDHVDAIFYANPHDMIHRTENFLLQFWPSTQDRSPLEPAAGTAAIPHDDAHAEIRRWAQGL